MDLLPLLASSDESGTTSESDAESSHMNTRVANPRRLPLPAAHEMESGIGKAQFLGVTYRKDRESTRPWVARYLDCTIGNYKSALDAAVARWICSKYDRDVLQEDGSWCGQAYQRGEERHLVITRFTGASEDDVIRQIDQHLGVNSEPVQTPQTPNKSSLTEPVMILPPPNPPANMLPPGNPRRDATLPSRLPRTSGRGQYRGVIESKGKYVARWNNTLHLGTYNTAFEAGLAVYIAEHFDRDVEKDGHHGSRGRAYMKSVKGKPAVYHFRATTEAELVRLIDEFHGVVGRAENDIPPSASSAAILPLDQAVRRFWNELWLKYSEHDGHAVCQELYLIWQLFLAQNGLPHLVKLKEKEWCGAMEKVLGLQRFNLPYDPLAQALSIPTNCRLPVKQRKGAPVWRSQWFMAMTATCEPEVCVKTWSRRREDSKRRDVLSRHIVIEGEIEERGLLKQRLPEWVDDWVRPALLTMAEKITAAKKELAEVDMKTLACWIKLEPEHPLFTREMDRRTADPDGL
jgi:hypothetical protein